jgi:hypothetical protein
LNYLIEYKSYFLALKKATDLIPYRGRKASTLINILAWLGQRIQNGTIVDAGVALDEQLALQAESFIRTNIIFLWHRFDQSVDHVTDATECARAKEPPRRTKNGNVLVEIPHGYCKKRQCNNANFFHSNFPTIRKVCESLDALRHDGVELSQELKNAREEMRLALGDPGRLYNYDNCMSVGDVWLHLECLASGIRDFGTTNYKESQHLCPILGLNMKLPHDKEHCA